MAKTYSFDVSAPANSNAPSGGAAAIRLLKNAIHERENLDHYWEKSGDTADVDDIGYHRQVTLLVQTSETAKANAGKLYTKDVSAKAELHFIDEDSNEIQITSAGALNVSSAFTSGDLLLTTRSGAISGWTDVTTTYASKYLRIGATGLATGGSATHTHTYSSTSGAGGTHRHAMAPYTTGGYGRVDGNEYTDYASDHTHSVSGTTANGDTTPLYVDVRMYQKD